MELWNSIYNQLNMIRKDSQPTIVLIVNSTQSRTFWDCLDQVDLWACLWRIVLIMLTDVGRFSLNIGSTISIFELWIE